MGALRVLGRSVCFDDLEDATFIDEDTHLQCTALRMIKLTLCALTCCHAHRCCVLHNMLIEEDGIERRLLEDASDAAIVVQPDLWQDEIQRRWWNETDRLWEKVGMHEQEDVEQYNDGVRRRVNGGFALLPARMSREYHASGVQWHVCNYEVGCEREREFFVLRDALVTHYWYASRHGKIRWIA